MQEERVTDYTGIGLLNDKKNIIYSIENDFKVEIEEKSVPITQTLSYHPLGILGVCLQGSIVIDIYMHEYRFTKGDLMVVLPGQIVSVKEKSSDFKLNYFVVSQPLLNDVLEGVPRLSPLFFIHMRRKPHYKLSKEETYRFLEYYNMIHSWVSPVDSMFRVEYITNMLRLFYLDLYNNYKNGLLHGSYNSDTRKEKLTYDFFLLIMTYHRENREIAFYAQKLFVTPKYLSAVIKEVSGRSAKDWIVEYTIIEIQDLLKNPALNIQEITIKMNFSNQASLGRFFRKHTGVSPTQYRMER